MLYFLNFSYFKEAVYVIINTIKNKINFSKFFTKGKFIEVLFLGGNNNFKVIEGT